MVEFVGEWHGFFLYVNGFCVLWREQLSVCCDLNGFVQWSQWLTFVQLMKRRGLGASVNGYVQLVSGLTTALVNGWYVMSIYSMCFSLLIGGAVHGASHLCYAYSSSSLSPSSLGASLLTSLPAGGSKEKKGTKARQGTINLSFF